MYMWRDSPLCRSTYLQCMLSVEMFLAIYMSCSLILCCSNEYYPADLNVAPTQDLRKSSLSGSKEEEEGQEEDTEETEDSEVQTTSRKGTSSKPGRDVVKSKKQRRAATGYVPSGIGSSSPLIKYDIHVVPRRKPPLCHFVYRDVICLQSFNVCKHHICSVYVVKFYYLW